MVGAFKKELIEMFADQWTEEEPLFESVSPRLEGLRTTRGNNPGVQGTVMVIAPSEKRFDVRRNG